MVVAMGGEGLVADGDAPSAESRRLLTRKGVGVMTVVVEGPDGLPVTVAWLMTLQIWGRTSVSCQGSCRVR